MKVVLQDLVRNKEFIECVKVTTRYQEVLVKESSCSHMEIICTVLKRNIKQKIEVDFPKINCLRLKNNRLLILIILKKILLLKNYLFHEKNIKIYVD